MYALHRIGAWTVLIGLGLAVAIETVSVEVFVGVALGAFAWDRWAAARGRAMHVARAQQEVAGRR